MHILTSILRKKLVLAVLAAAVVGSAAYAFAATLSVSSNSLGAGDAAVSSCDTDGIKTSFSTQYDSTAAAYIVKNVVVSGIAGACVSDTTPATLQVTLTQDPDNNPATANTTSEVVNLPLTTTATGLSGTLDARLVTTDVSSSAVPAKDVTHVDAALAS